MTKLPFDRRFPVLWSLEEKTLLSDSVRFIVNRRIPN